jgi:hypothetical protein
MKRYRPGWIFFLLFLTMVIITISCRKSNLEGLLLGRWSRINVVNIDTPFVEDWEFQNSGTLIIHFAKPGPGDTINDQASYALTAYNKFDIQFPNKHPYEQLSGNWQVIRKKNGYLMIVLNHKGHGLTFREFQKQ